MKNRSKIILLGAAVAAFLCGCAKEKTESEADSIKREFEAWMSLNYPGATASGRGVYIINDVPGTGDAISPGTEWHGHSIPRPSTPGSMMPSAA